MDTIPGFSAPNAVLEFGDSAPEKFKSRKGKKSGGFQSMGLSHDVLRGITKRGYQQPTPIQRKVN